MYVELGGSGHMREKRESGVELLRIISMVFIVMSHYCVHNELLAQNMPISFNMLIEQFGILGNLGVDIFFLLSGFFLSKNENPFSIKKMIKLLVEVWLYSIGIYILLYIAGIIDFSVKDFIKAFLPTIFMEYSYFTIYIIIYILSPFLNNLINSLEEKRYNQLLLFLVMIMCVIPMITTTNFVDSYLLDGITLYVVGAWLNKEFLFVQNIRKTISIKCLPICLIFWMIGGGISLLLNRISDHFSSIYLYTRNSCLTIFVAVVLVIIFTNFHFYSKTINSIGSNVFAVFLISDNNYLRSIIWLKIFPNGDLVNSPFLLFHLLACCLAIFCICILIDRVREQLIRFIICKFK